MCFKQDGNALYIKNNDNCISGNTSTFCDFDVSVPENRSQKFFVLSPNPAHDFINIKNEQQKELSITIFSSIGEVVLKTTLAKDAEAIINFSGFAAGIYLVTAKSDKSFAGRKIIKE